MASNLALAQAPRDPNGFTTDTLEQVKTHLGNGTAVLVDVREPAEWNRGHLAVARSLPISQLQAWLSDNQITDAEHAEARKLIPANTIVYTHCAKGGRALIAHDLLRSLGIEARPLSAGYDTLLRAGFPKANTPPR
jgi:rhodanese-related sulfurtransferase